jgi:hypothetical protein
MSESMAFSLGLLVFGLTLVLWALGAVLYLRDRPAAAGADGSAPEGPASPPQGP